MPGHRRAIEAVAFDVRELWRLKSKEPGQPRGGGDQGRLTAHLWLRGAGPRLGAGAEAWLRGLRWTLPLAGALRAASRQGVPAGGSPEAALEASAPVPVREAEKHSPTTASPLKGILERDRFSIRMHTGRKEDEGGVGSPKPPPGTTCCTGARTASTSPTPGPGTGIRWRQASPPPPPADLARARAAPGPTQSYVQQQLSGACPGETAPRGHRRLDPNTDPKGRLGAADAAAGPWVPPGSGSWGREASAQGLREAGPASCGAAPTP